MKTRNLVLTFAVAIFCLGQTIPASAQLWKLDNYLTISWTSVASSADGSKLVAVADGPIYSTTDFGLDWTSNSVPFTNWNGVASSADGNRLVAVNGGGGVYTNSGISWFPSPLTVTGPTPAWQCVASSVSGSNLVVAGFQPPSTNLIYYSTNAGVTWAKATAPNVNVQSIDFTAGGTNLIAAGTNEVVLTSKNAGANWSTLNNTPPINLIAASTNGLKLAGIETGTAGPVYTSTDAGSTWVTNSLIPASSWSSLASSSDGTRLVGTSSGTGIYQSADSGADWRQGSAGYTSYTSVASSGSGSNLVAVATNLIFVGITPLPALTLSLAGKNVWISWSTNVMGYNAYLFSGTNADRVNQSPFPVQPLPVITNGVYRTTVPLTNGPAFFWLNPAAA